jgi:3-oxoacyl-[acyl-carrier protein] reductase
MAEDLTGKVVLVTGASTGIGAAVARAFARHGCTVAVHCNSHIEEAESVAHDARACGAAASVFRGDVTRSSDIARVVSEVFAAFGHIDILVNNAGSMVERRPIESYDEDYVLQVLQVNAVQVAMFMRSVIPAMRVRRSGNVINVSSISARHGGGNGGIIYAAAKGFVATATRGWAKEVANDAIRVNAVSPGVIATPFHARHSTIEQMQRMRAQIPMARIGSPEDCTGTFIYLASDSLSGYVTGQVIEVNGGQYMP